MFLDTLASSVRLGEFEYHIYVKIATWLLLNCQMIQSYKSFHLDAKDFVNTLLKVRNFYASVSP